MKRTLAFAGALLAALGTAESPAAGQVQHRLVPQVVVAVDLPFQGASADTSSDTYRMVQLYLDRNSDRAGSYAVKLRKYDDSTAAAGTWDDATCASNGREHVRQTDEVAVLGPMNSGCAAIEVPYLNQAPDGPMLMVSHANTYPGLTTRMESGEPGKFYPTGKRNYARVVTTDAYEGVAAARFANGELRKRRVYVLDDGTSYGRMLANTFSREARRLGMTLVGRRSWNPGARNYRPLFRTVKAKHPGVLLVSGIYDNNGGQLLKDKNAVLGGSRAVPVVATDGFTGYPDLDYSTFGRGLFMTFAGLSRVAVLQNNPVARQLNAAFKAKYGHYPVSAYPFYAVAAMQVIRAAIAASDGTRASVNHAVFSGTGIKIAKDKSALGRGFTISTATGDTNAHDLTVEVIRSRRELLRQTYRF